MQQIPVAQDLFRWSDDSAALLGSKCAGCDTYYFPQSLSCRNPGCTDKRVEPAEFGAAGRLYSFTVQSYRPPALFRMDDWEPYTLGLVALPEGVRVLAMLTGCAPAEIEVGMPLVLTARPLYTNDAGAQVMTYMYQPAGLEATP